jgi:hypothetical protein
MFRQLLWHRAIRISLDKPALLHRQRQVLTLPLGYRVCALSALYRDGEVEPVVGR